jgi:hypothetical protein
VAEQAGVSSSAGQLQNGRWPNFVPTSDSGASDLTHAVERPSHLDRVVRAGSHHLRA